MPRQKKILELENIEEAGSALEVSTHWSIYHAYETYHETSHQLMLLERKYYDWFKIINLHHRKYRRAESEREWEWKQNTDN